MLQKLTQTLATKPYRMFLIDGIGAVVSAVLLGGVLASFESTFGMPADVLHGLAAVACVFAVYSFFSFIRKPDNWQPFLRVIAILNAVYCCVTIGLVIHFYGQLSLLGILYFGGEVILVLSLVGVELKVASTK